MLKTLGAARGRVVWQRWLAGLLLGLLFNIALGVAGSTPAVARQTQEFGRQDIARQEIVRQDVVSQDVISIRALPPEAQRVLVLIRQGGPFPHKKDGVTFFNRERLLPSQARGYYTEYTVPTPGARNRGARRIVAGRGAGGNPATSGEYWYTSDHYSSFQRIQE